jgi:hypothetical protein
MAGNRILVDETKLLQNVTLYYLQILKFILQSRLVQAVMLQICARRSLLQEHPYF